eukprot:TRINITY_DN17318_c0_g1_i4.p1 TRINITY_DN17318_c0_g1~~TRINITY_DN17318_c0_g1_i4.p1  ORF type:complete len:382 (-),score=67.16 TRINITY_DN17318_c0_g1_i4:76-1221(-)
MCIRDSINAEYGDRTVPMVCRFLLPPLLIALAACIPLHHPHIPRNHAQNLTVYHLNPLSAGELPVNMDTGDALGDLYFYLGQFLLPLECANATNRSRAHFDCDNPERISNDLVVTQVDLEIDNRATGYSGCNICNGTDPLSGKPCEVGKYICDCESSFMGGPPCDPSKVGVDNVTASFAPPHPSDQCKADFERTCGSVKTDEDKCWNCWKSNYNTSLKTNCAGPDAQVLCPNPWDFCKDGSPKVPWSCWETNIVRKTGGWWYSTQEEGHCDGTNKPSCSWRTFGSRTINETCLRDTVASTVESHDKDGCFNGCGVRNMSSSCWIGCFFDTLLGPEASTSYSKPLGGMAVEDVQRSWTDAFQPPEQGGCPPIRNSGVHAIQH